MRRNSSARARDGRGGGMVLGEGGGKDGFCGGGDGLLRGWFVRGIVCEGVF